LLEIGMQRRFHARQKSGAEQYALRAERQRGDKTASVSEPARGQYRDWADGIAHHRDQGHAAHPTNVPSTLAALGYDDIGPGLRGADRLLHSACHVGDFAARLMSPVKIWAELLVGSRPSELHDRRTQLECRGETVLARVKQQEVQTEWLIGFLAGCRRALTNLFWIEVVTAHSARAHRRATPGMGSFTPQRRKASHTIACCAVITLMPSSR